MVLFNFLYTVAIAILQVYQNKLASYSLKASRSGCVVRVLVKSKHLLRYAKRKWGLRLTVFDQTQHLLRSLLQISVFGGGADSAISRSFLGISIFGGGAGSIVSRSYLGISIFGWSSRILVSLWTKVYCNPCLGFQSSVEVLAMGVGLPWVRRHFYALIISLVLGF